jgi:hypothetical protein
MRSVEVLLNFLNMEKAAGTAVVAAVGSSFQF